MRVLTDNDMVEMVEDGLLFKKSTFEKERCEGVFYGLRLGEQAYSVTFQGSRQFDEKGELAIQPKECINVASVEWLNFPAKYAGLICSQVSFLAEGICHIATTVDPGWNGTLTITLFNVGNRPFYIEKGEAFCKLMILEMDEAPCRDHSEFGKHVAPGSLYMPTRQRPWSPALSNAPTDEELKFFADDYGPPYDFLASRLLQGSAELCSLTSRVDRWDETSPVEVGERLAKLEEWKGSRERREVVLATLVGGLSGAALAVVVELARIMLTAS